MYIKERYVLKTAPLGCHNILPWNKNEWINFLNKKTNQTKMNYEQWEKIIIVSHLFKAKKKKKCARAISQVFSWIWNLRGKKVSADELQA